MATDAIRTELKVSGDKRIRVGLRGAIEHIGGRHGLSAAEQREFANEVDAECCKITAEGEPGASCEVVVEEQEDQIEVKVRPASESTLRATAPRQATSAENSKHKADGEHSQPHGRANRTADNGHFAATLVRHFHKNPAHS